MQKLANTVEIAAFILRSRVFRDFRGQGIGFLLFQFRLAFEQFLYRASLYAVLLLYYQMMPPYPPDGEHENQHDCRHRPQQHVAHTQFRRVFFYLHVFTGDVIDGG